MPRAAPASASGTIRNKNTSLAYYRAGAASLRESSVTASANSPTSSPIHVAAYIAVLQTTAAKPTVKLHLAAIRTLFDRLVVGQILAINPAHALSEPCAQHVR
jgi:site-specific recombinase XerC